VYELIDIAYAWSVKPATALGSSQLRLPIDIRYFFGVNKVSSSSLSAVAR
jgi:hypothetical protein